MTKNFSPVTEPGTARTRAVGVSLQNTYGYPPAITWMQEEQILMQDGSFKYVQGQPLHSLVDETLLNTDIPLFDPDTEESYGTVKGMQILLMIQCLYIYLAKAEEARLAALANPPAPEPEPEV